MNVSLSEYVASIPWAITHAAYDGICAAAGRMEMTPEQAAAMHANGDPMAVRAFTGEKMDGARTVHVRDGVAIIPVRGPLFRYANLMTNYSGATSYQAFATDFQAAMDNPEVHAILLEMDSPGGMVVGCGETARMVYEARGVKRVETYGGGLMCSGGYYIGSAAEKVTIDPSAILGSIGVLMGTAPKSSPGRDDARWTLSKNARNKRIDPDSREGRDLLEAEIDAMEDVFIGDVAKFRGISVETVVADFGQGGCFVGQQAIDAGLADALGSFESVIARLAGMKTKDEPAVTDSDPHAGIPALAETAAQLVTPPKRITMSLISKFNKWAYGASADHGMTQDEIDKATDAIAAMESKALATATSLAPIQGAKPIIDPIVSMPDLSQHPAFQKMERELNAHKSALNSAREAQQKRDAGDWSASLVDEGRITYASSEAFTGILAGNIEDDRLNPRPDGEVSRSQELRDAMALLPTPQERYEGSVTGKKVLTKPSVARGPLSHRDAPANAEEADQILADLGLRN